MSSSDQELHTWQEIAAYLQVSVRTAQDYEKTAGLPVHRIPGRRSRVTAYASELEKWKGRRQTEGAVPEPIPVPAAPASTPASRSRRWIFLAAAGAVTLLVIALTWWTLRRHRAVPANFEARGNELTVFDSSGHKLWKHTFAQPLIDRVYENEEDRKRLVRFIDLDGDGSFETLFTFNMTDRRQPGSAIYCFSNTGQIKWKYAPGRPLSDQKQALAPVYSISEFAVASPATPGGAWIAVTSVHGWSHPSVVTVLGPDGSKLGEYFHAGYVPHLKLVDLDRDNIPEILVGGVAEGYEQATLVVLDHRRVFGASTQPVGDTHHFQGLPTGAEEAVVYFPRSCITQATQEHNVLKAIEVTGDSILAHVVESVNADDPDFPYIIYELTRNLKLQNAVVSDQFVGRHHTLEREHILDHQYSYQRCIPLKQFRVVRRQPATGG